MGKFNKYKRKNFKYQTTQNLVIFVLFIIAALILILIKRHYFKLNQRKIKEKNEEREKKEN